MKIIIFVLLFGTQFSIVFEPDSCKKDLIETYHIDSFVYPKPVKLFMCPTVKLSCCQIFDQYKIFNLWESKIKP